MASTVEDKITHLIAGKASILYSIDAFLKAGTVEDFLIVYRDDAQQAKLEAVTDTLSHDIPIHWTAGGKTRQASVLNALLALPESTDYVFIHDTARPLVEPSAIQKLFRATLENKAAVLAHRVHNTIKRVTATNPLATPATLENLNRSQLWAMETPQAFEYTLIKNAYTHCLENNIHITDDTSAAAACKHPVQLVENTTPNPKLTTPADLDYLEFLAQQRSSS